ncbi:aldehyde dehydrogenase family protein [Nocardia gipuzkoensis]|uniref:aldehyde dehydrogenase family protein n=1 Tax=Nocardia gipuzkoensis TaxID=2749991 RepID=UPI00237E05AF|nr:aldehyde dehydrogenase family protein [Nocardia gipuzkoensis]MDE1674869.1 aldehyde dehydrogenase family protein [Nocardia gipuzkoensis]
MEYDMRTGQQMLIGGNWVSARDGATFEAHNPANGELLAIVPEAGVEDVAAAVTAGLDAAPAWNALGHERRAEALRRCADAVEADLDRLAYLDSLGVGNPVRAAIGDGANGLQMLRYMCNVAGELKGTTLPVGHDFLDYTLRQPYGVVARIIPFNHPLGFTIEKIAAPLLAGNTVILKPSPLGVVACLEAVRVIAPYLPAGVLQVVTDSAGGAGAVLVAHPKVKRIAFTGSVATARRIQLAGAEGGIKACSFELGGKNPLIVFPDADIDAAVSAAVTGMNLTRTLGQSCGSTSRLFLPDSIHDEFVDRLVDRLAQLQPGIPTLPSTQLGCLASAAQLAKVEAYVESGFADGALLRIGGRRPSGAEFRNGMFYLPTLFDNVRTDMRIARDEIFGPVLSVFTWSDENELLASVNDVEYGLTANIWTSNLNTAVKFARDVQAGYIWVNGRDGRHFPGAPFGGYKNSGLGTETSIDELLSYTELKNVSIWLPPEVDQ